MLTFFFKLQTEDDLRLIQVQAQLRKRSAFNAGPYNFPEVKGTDTCIEMKTSH
jgi:hypothetical protein